MLVEIIIFLFQLFIVSVEINTLYIALKNEERKIKMNELEEFCKSKLYYESALKVLETQLDIIKSELSIMNNCDPINHIKTRIKSLGSILGKLYRKNIEISIENIEKLNDIVGGRIVCNFLDDVYEVIDCIKKNTSFRIINEKDFIKEPKPSGYRGYHIIITIPISINGVTKDISAEIQVRTTAMDFWASNEHKLNYKSDKSSKLAKEELLKTSESLWSMDVTMNNIYRENKQKEDDNSMFKKLDIISKIAKNNILKFPLDPK